MNGDDRNPSMPKERKKNITGSNFSNSEHKVKIVGDSHLKGSAARINQYLNTKIEVCSWIKPDVNTEHL